MGIRIETKNAFECKAWLVFGLLVIAVWFMVSHVSTRYNLRDGLPPETHTHTCSIWQVCDSDCRDDGKALPPWHVPTASLPPTLQTTALLVAERYRAAVTFVGRRNNCTACWNEQPP